MHRALFRAVTLTLMLPATYGLAADTQKPAGLAAEVCRPTPPQTEGPYYPPKAQMDAQVDKDNDLTQVQGDPGRPKGQLLYVKGRVRDANCRAIAAATVEIWQASENGRYRHPRDTENPAPLDPHFQYWGKAVTDKEGRYLFKTIKPGAYSIGQGRTRPSHIHFKVSHPEFRDFITQMYFAGDPYQDQDFILRDIPPSERDLVVVSMEPPAPDQERDAKICRFDLTLR
jgi:protocatechuate 3,4-dioxygenase beta subunit